MTRKHFQLLATPAAIALTLAFSGTVQAQPDGNNAPKGKQSLPISKAAAGAVADAVVSTT